MTSSREAPPGTWFTRSVVVGPHPATNSTNNARLPTRLIVDTHPTTQGEQPRSFRLATASEITRLLLGDDRTRRPARSLHSCVRWRVGTIVSVGEVHVALDCTLLIKRGCVDDSPAADVRRDRSVGS